MYIYILLAALICLMPMAAYGSEVNNTTVHLVITTHNPSCTAVHLDRLGAARLTDVQPTVRDGVFGYGADEFREGINVTAAVWTHEANKTASNMLERLEVRGVAAYLPAASNTTLPEQPVLLASHIDAYTDSLGRFDFPMPCDIDQKVVERLLDAIGRGGASDIMPASKFTTASDLESDIASGSASDSAPVSLVITTRSPWCTAAHLDYLGVTRVTDVRPYWRDGVDGYSADEYVFGINVTAVVWAHEAHQTVSEIIEQPVVDRVAAYSSIASNATLPERQTLLTLDINPDPEMPEVYGFPTRCSVPTNLVEHVLDDIGWAGASNPTPMSKPVQKPLIISEPLVLDKRPPRSTDPESGIVYSGDLMSVAIYTYNATGAWVFLKGNGALVDYVVDNDGGLGYVSAYMPLSLMWPLFEKYHITAVKPERYVGSEGYGDIETEGLGNIHQNVKSWHDQGHNGTGVKVGVIDEAFDVNSAELPNVSILNSDVCKDSDAGAVTHGTSVAEILMDMAPGVDLHLACASDKVNSLHEAVDLLLEKKVSVISMSMRYPYEGPGDGTTTISKNSSALWAIEKAVKNGTIWVNSAGNYGDRGWTFPRYPTENIQTVEGGDGWCPTVWVDFNATAGKDKDNWIQHTDQMSPAYTDIDLRWAGGGELLLRLYNSNGNELLTNIVHVGENAPAQSLAVTRNLNLRIEVKRDCSFPLASSPTVPKWIQLVAYGKDTDMEYTTAGGSINGMADSSSSGMLAVGARLAQSDGTASEYGIPAYTSWGHTSDWRFKPDTMGATHVSTSKGTFPGTSAGAPHVAGIAALMIGRADTPQPPETIAGYLGGLKSPRAPGPITGDDVRMADVVYLDGPGESPNNSPFVILTKSKDITMHQGRTEHAYTILVKDLDRSDAILWNATSSNSSVVTVDSPSKRTEMDKVSFSPEHRYDGIHLMPHSAGTATITVDVTDGVASATHSFGVTVTDNTHPVMGPIGSQYVTIGVDRTIAFKATDIDGDTLSYSYVIIEVDKYFKIKNPGDCETKAHVRECKLPGSTLTMTPISAGKSGMLYGVFDGQGGNAIDAVELYITKSNVAPVQNNISDMSIYNGETVTVRIQATDADGDNIISMTPLSSNLETVRATIPIHMPHRESTGISSGIALGMDSGKVERITIENDTLVSMTVSKRSPTGDVFRYAVNSTGIMPAIPESVTIANDYKRSPTPTTLNQTLTISGLSVGNTTLSTTVYDVWGGYDTKNFTVTVLPGKPVIRLAGSANMSISLGSAYVEPGYTATDPEDGIITGNVTVTGKVNATKLGTYTLHYDVSDSSGQAAVQQNRTIRVIPDKVPPVIVLYGSINMTMSVNSTYVEPGYNATDDVDGVIAGNVTVTGAVNASVLGNYTLHYDVSDSAGNKAMQQSRTIRVIPDKVPPVIVLYGSINMTMSANSTYVEPGYNATDDVEGDITKKVEITNLINAAVLGAYRISYDASDSAGNTAIPQNRTVHVIPDRVPPVITLFGSANMTVPFGSKYVDPGYSATDDVDGNITGSVTVTGTVNSTALGAYTLHYGITDSSGNAAITQNRTVHVIDTAAPIITLSGSANMTIPFGSKYAEPGYSATDDVDGNITGSVTVTGAVNSTALGAYTLHYNVKDSSGNPAVQQNRTVMVSDIISPIITLSGSTNMTIQFGSKYVEPGYNATDDIDGVITGNVVVTGKVNSAAPGTYTLHYNVKDGSGNSAITQNRTVHVIDTVAPVIALSGSTNMTIQFGSKYVEPGYTATDNADGDITGNVTVTGTVNTGRLGAYALHYDVTDSSGNPAVQQNRTVIIADTAMPVITLLGPTAMNISVGSTYVEPGYNATDNADGVITGNVTVTGTVDTGKLGAYTLHYDVTDSSGNPAVQQSRAVNVIPDKVAPVIKLSGSANMTVSFGSAFVEPGYSATDNADGDISGNVTVTGTVNTGKLGAYTLHYDVTDSSGNPAITQNRTVHVMDTTAPVITLSGSANMTVPFGSTYVEPGYNATDNADGVITGNVTVTGTVDTGKLGAYTLHYDVTDSSGNPAVQQSRAVNVIPDKVAPVIKLSGSANMTVSFGSAFVEPGYSATDNADGDISGNVTVTGTVNTGKLGAYTLHYDVTDSSGNPAITQNRTVHVMDTTAPVITLSGPTQITLPSNGRYSEPGYVAADDVDGDITSNVKVAWLPTSTEGVFTLSYEVKDSSGNHAIQKTRTVTIVR